MEVLTPAQPQSETLAAEPGQRAYEAYVATLAAPQYWKSWAESSDGVKGSWAAVETALTALPAPSASLREEVATLLNCHVRSFIDDHTKTRGQCIDALADKIIPLVLAQPLPETPGAREAFIALDIADRLIERGYGTDAPTEWGEAYAAVAEARAHLAGPTT